MSEVPRENNCSSPQDEVLTEESKKPQVITRDSVRVNGNTLSRTQNFLEHSSDLHMIGYSLNPARVIILRYFLVANPS